jgi:hypothetical protein
MEAFIVLKPGFASIDVDAHASEQFEVAADSGFADAADADEASAIWHEYHLCLRCAHRPICKWATTEEAPVVIARCLSFVALADARGDNG